MSVINNSFWRLLSPGRSHLRQTLFMYTFRILKYSHPQWYELYTCTYLIGSCLTFWASEFSGATVTLGNPRYFWKIWVGCHLCDVTSHRSEVRSHRSQTKIASHNSWPSHKLQVISHKSLGASEQWVISHQWQVMSPKSWSSHKSYFINDTLWVTELQVTSHKSQVMSHK